MKAASDMRPGNVIRFEKKICKVLSHEMKGTGKFGKSAHVKFKNLEDGNMIERTLRSEDRYEEVDITYATMQYSYKDGDNFVFMNMENYEQFTIPGSTVGKQEVFLKENMEIDVEFVDGLSVCVSVSL